MAMQQPPDDVVMEVLTCNKYDCLSKAGCRKRRHYRLCRGAAEQE